MAFIRRRHVFVLVFRILLVPLAQYHAFLPPPPPPGRSNRPQRGQNDDYSGGAPSSNVLGWYSPPKEDSLLFSDSSMNRNRQQLGKRNQTATSTWSLDSRGGAREVPKKPAPASVESVGTFWTRSFQAAGSTLLQPFRSVQQMVQRLSIPKRVREEQALLQELQALPIRRVTVPNTTVLPESVITMAARRAGMIGSPLEANRVRTLAQHLQDWYRRQGYTLHTVQGATLQPESATAEIQVSEPCLAHPPMQMITVQQMVVDDETGQLVTFSQYKKKHATRKTFGYDKLTLQNLNTTYVVTEGRTRPSKICAALGLQSGQPFQWNMDKWGRIVKSGLFTRVLQVEPQQTSHGTVQLQVVVQERPPRHLEYGLGKSLYTNSWEGELDVEHGNLLGGGERLGLSLRRSRKETKPSVRLHYTDDRFGMNRGYAAEVFGDFVSDDDQKQEEGKSLADEGVVDVDSILDRKGATFRIRNPIRPDLLTNSVVSASAERTRARTGLQENIGSAKLTLGPVTQELPLGARSNFDVTVLAGTRLAKKPIDSTSTNEEGEDVPSSGGLRVRPFTSLSATTRQLFPLLTRSRSAEARPLILAFRHTATTSAAVPWHQAKVQGQASDIRGSTPNDRVATSVRGTTELRVPVDLPLLPASLQDVGVVVFGDWLFARAPASSSFFRKSSMGLGLRKNIQGIPLQFDVCYANDGKFRTAFGLGGDFDV